MEDRDTRNYWAELQREKQLRGNIAYELKILEERYKNLQISNKSNCTKLLLARGRCEQLQHENDRLQNQLNRQREVIESLSADLNKLRNIK
jgi:hypothetical protein